MMKDSDVRIKFITEYIVSYKAKIESLNKCGLFDSATLYEIFAKEVCNLWFGQKFSNLNTATANFPYVDLISDDGQIYVQVSTTQDIPMKIRETLEKIRDNKSNKNLQIEKLYFFMLGNGSADKVKDYSGDKKIGNIDFVAKDNLITTKEIIERVKEDLQFQIGLYNVLYKESCDYSQTESKVYEAICISKTLINTNIEDLINGEYEIDRSCIINEIKKNNARFISIQGEAGSGKSALCKKLLCNEERLLFARAEKIAEAKALEDVWGFDVNRALEYLNGKRIVFYIDALEFIADGLKVKLDLLQHLYEIAKKYRNVIIVTSCRTCDRTAFLKIENLYGIRVYNVDLLTAGQIVEVAKRYDVIKDLWDKKAYMQLLRSPFYVNLIVSNIHDASRIADIDDFRKLIWSDIICMKVKSLPSGLKTSDIRNAVEKIVFKRAKDFLIGVSIEDIGEEIVEVLLSENIVTCCGENRVRLKYDIFEDICFERLIDRKYEECRGNYVDFYDAIDDMGSCKYRRYQIWVENKLLSKKNRDKFLFKLLKTNNIPEKWYCQTIVGITKSYFCGDFFSEVQNDITEDIFFDFLRLTNLFAFDASIIRLKNDNVYAQLRPVGDGRRYLIGIIDKTELYKKNESMKEQVIKICLDYSRTVTCEKNTAESACRVLEYYVQKTIEKMEQACTYGADEEINEYLLAIYRMAEYSSEWIKAFWNTIIQLYIKGDEQNSDWLEKILVFVLKNTTPALAIFLPRELCEVADTYWIKEQKKDEHGFCYSGMAMAKENKYGLSLEADLYSYEFRTVIDNMFIKVLVQHNFFVALGWIIRLTNHAALSYRKRFNDDVFDAQIWIDTPDNAKPYICHPDFWLAGVRENSVHKLIGDSLYTLIKAAVKRINSDNIDKTVALKFAKIIKDTIIEKSNNIMMLTVIEEIGRQCIEKLPGYAMELASSIDLIMLDIQKTAILLPGSDIQLLKKQILLTIDMPRLNQRYELNNENVYSLQEYMIRMQMLEDEQIREKAEIILDYLYSIIPNSRENAKLNLQVQKMDLRNTTVSKLDDNLYALIPKIDGEAKKLVEESGQSRYNVEKREFDKVIEKVNSQLADNSFDTKACLVTIEIMIDNMKKSFFPYQMQNALVLLISCALSKPDLDKEERSRLCCIWIDGIEEIFKNNSFVFDIILVKVLFSQIDKEINEDTRKRIKYLMLKCLLYRDNNGIIYRISNYLKEYLITNEDLAKILFYTIIALSEDEMNRFIYNASQIAVFDDSFEYVPNMQKPPIWVENFFKEKHIPKYSSRREQLIEDILINENSIDLSQWNIGKCDVKTLCYVSNCGLGLEDSNFFMIMSRLFPYLIEIISSGRKVHEYVDTYAIEEVKCFFKRELVYKENVDLALHILFGAVDLSIANHDVYELYEDMASFILSVYFYEYKDAAVRRRCENTIKKIENHISVIKDDDVKKRLSKMLFLTLGTFHMADWNDSTTKFSYEDKMFLNGVWSKYGSNHFKNMIKIIHQLHIEELLPEVLIALDTCMNTLKADTDEFRKLIKETETILNEIITKAFLDFNDVIKLDEDLTCAYEGVLETLVSIDMEEAAVFLDEFRVH